MNTDAHRDLVIALEHIGQQLVDGGFGSARSELAEVAANIHQVLTLVVLRCVALNGLTPKHANRLRVSLIEPEGLGASRNLTWRVIVELITQPVFAKITVRAHRRTPVVQALRRLARCKMSASTAEAVRELVTVFSEYDVGEVYEYFASLTPSIQANCFRLKLEKGRPRKSRGLFYTPEVLVDFVVGRLSRSLHAKHAKRPPRICDPACGSGRFLRRVVAHLSESLEVDVSRIVTDQIFGVDVDPMAVELTRFQLLSFTDGGSDAVHTLNANIRCGDAIYGSGGHRLGRRRDELNPELFHWTLEFPQVFEGGDGFDVVIGNPPWEKLEVLQREHAPSPQFTNLRDGGRKCHARLLSELKAERKVLREYVRSSKEYQLCGHGRLNAYALFVERGLDLLSRTGCLSMLVPSGILTDYSTRRFTQFIVSEGLLRAVSDFDNRDSLFRDIQGNIQFCLLELGVGSKRSFRVSAKQRAVCVADMYEMHSRDVRLINPETSTVPLFQSVTDYRLVRKIYSKGCVLGQSDWFEGIKQGHFNMTTDAKRFSRAQNQEGTLVPLYEAKLCHQFNHRYRTFEGVDESRRFRLHAGTNVVGDEELGSPAFEVMPRYWVDRDAFDCRAEHTNWFLVYRNSMSAMADARSCVATVVPRVAVGNSLSLLMVNGNGTKAAILTSLLNSLVFDYVLKQKSSGSNVNFYVMRQLPCIAFNRLALPHPLVRSMSIKEWIVKQSVALSCTSSSLDAFAKDCGLNAQSLTYDADERLDRLAQLDALWCFLFGLDATDVRWLLERFDVLKRREARECGMFATSMRTMAHFRQYLTVA